MNRYREQGYIGYDNPFDKIQSAQYIPQYQGLPLDEILKTGSILSQNYQQFELGKGAVEATINNLANAVPEGAKELATKIREYTKDRLKAIAESNDYANMGIEIAQLSQNFNSKIAPILADKEKVDKAIQDILADKAMDSELKNLNILNIKKNGIIPYEYDKDLNIISGGYRETVPLSALDRDKTMASIISGIENDSWGLTGQRAEDIIIPALERTGVTEYAKQRTDLELLKRGIQLRDMGLSENEINEILDIEKDKIYQDIVTPFYNEAYNKIVNYQMDKSGSSGSRSSNPGLTDTPVQRSLIEAPINTDNNIIPEYENYIGGRNNFMSQRNKAAMDIVNINKWSNGFIKEGEGKDIRYYQVIDGKKEDRTDEVNFRITQANKRFQDLEDIHNKILDKAIQNYALTHNGIILSKDEIKKTILQSDNDTNVLSRVPFSGTPGSAKMFGGKESNLPASEQARLDIIDALNKATQDVTAQKYSTTFEYQIYDNESGAQHEQDKALATSLNENKSLLKYVDMFGNESEDMKALMNKEKNIYLDPVSKGYNSKTGKWYTRVEVKQIDENGKHHSIPKSDKQSQTFAWIDNDYYWQDKAGKFERDVQAIDTEIIQNLPKDNKRVNINADTFQNQGWGSIIKELGLNYEVVNFGDGTYKVRKIVNGNADLEWSGTEGQIRKGITEDILHSLQSRLQQEDTPSLSKDKVYFKYGDKPQIFPEPQGAIKVPEVDEHYLSTLGYRESSGQYMDTTKDLKKGSKGSYTYGMYQFTGDTLRRYAFMDRNYNWTGKWGVNSREDFTPEVQERLIREYTAQNKRELQNLGAWDYIGKRINGILVTAKGLLAAAHLAGPKNVLEALKGGRVVRDMHGTSPLDYLKLFANS